MSNFKTKCGCNCRISRKKLHGDELKKLPMRIFIAKRKLKNGSQTNIDKWTPLYSLVTFSLTPYEALALGEYQNKIMEEMLKMDDITLPSGIQK
jgi:kynurenine 3-monooxygenase